ncbi:uncharacterized protein [Triticum aestivum]|uniref:uncharacterized protein isoform X3 n=1 Tax=Triticum aestivum TaxID=4565 RepID=UPI001D007870|nr:uncharacterized protein LOC123097944 isoform X3 [Triticum aestivum]
MEGPSRPHSPPLLLYMRDLAAAATAAAVALDDGEVGGVLDAQMQIPSLLVLCRADRDHGKRKEARRAGRQVLLASDCFLPDTPIQMTAAAMASTLKRAYLSIYNWVQVLYYVLLDSLPGRARRQLRGVSILRRPPSRRPSLLSKRSSSCVSSARQSRSPMAWTATTIGGRQF